MAPTKTASEAAPPTLNVNTASEFRYFEVRPGSYITSLPMEGEKVNIGRPGDILDLHHPVVRSWISPPVDQWFKLIGLKEVPKDKKVRPISDLRLKRLIEIHNAKHGEPSLDPESGYGGRGRPLDSNKAPMAMDPEVAKLRQENTKLQERIEALESASKEPEKAQGQKSKAK